MRQLGVSVYIGNADMKKNKEYLEKASRYGFTRIFTCLISIGNDKEGALKELRELSEYVKGLGMNMIADVTPKMFSELGASYQDLKPFKDMGLHGIRLDLGLTGIEESFMSYNEHGLKIELNMSNGTKYLDNILSYSTNKDNLIGCHNFYPHRYTGISREHFIKCSKQYRQYGLRTAAFVSSKEAGFGPWPIKEGLCTLEEHRNLPIDVQAKDLFNTDLIDDVIIANCFASEDELRLLGEMNRYLLTFKAELADGIPETEKKIVLDEPHFCRGDMSEYMIRSTQSRVKYAGTKFDVFNSKPIKRGDILIESSLYERYAGELQVALRDMENSGKTNVVGRVRQEELSLLDNIQPWQKFRFVESKQQ